jgi:hypothetical protein
MLRRTIALAIVATAGLSALEAQQPLSTKDDSAVQGATPSKLDLTPKTWSTLHGLIRPHEQEWRHLKVAWLTDVVAARRRAATEDKPIVICYTGGAGYNEPLGVC